MSKLGLVKIPLLFPGDLGSIWFLFLVLSVIQIREKSPGAFNTADRKHDSTTSETEENDTEFSRYSIYSKQFRKNPNLHQKFEQEGQEKISIPSSP